MTPRLWHIALYLVMALALVYAAVTGLDAYRQRRGAGQEHNAAVASGEAHAHQSQAQASDAAVADLQARLSAREADLGRLHAERNALLGKLASKPKPGADPAVGPVVGHDDSELSGISGELELLRATVEKDAEVIESLQADSVVKDSLITALTTSRDEWKATAEARERQAKAQEVATEAWKGAVKSAEWKGGLKGFAAGVALGYLAKGQR